MNRRDFFKGVAGGIAISSMPLRALADYASRTILGEKFIFDIDARTIGFTDLYRQVAGSIRYPL